MRQFSKPVGTIALLAAILSFSSACTDGVSGLGESDAGVDGGQVFYDGGLRPDALVVDLGPQPVDAGLPDLGPADSGVPTFGCTSEWREILVSQQKNGLRPVSVAVSGPTLALIHTEVDQDWAQTSFLTFYDRRGFAQTMPQPIDLNSQVVAVRDSFLVGGTDGSRWYNQAGQLVEKLSDVPFFPRAVINDKVYGLLPAAASDFHPAAWDKNFNELRSYPLPTPQGTRFAFGPDQIVVTMLDGPQLIVEHYGINGDSLQKLAEHRPQAVMRMGQSLRPGRMTAGRWSSASNSFEMLHEGVNGRIISGLHFRLNAGGLQDVDSLSEEFVEATHSLLNGAVAFTPKGRSAFACAKTLWGNEVSAELQIDGSAQSYELEAQGSVHGSLPLLLTTSEENFVLVASSQPPGRPSSGGSWPNQLLLRCIK